eukprot:701143-Pyramimonas_sp.AAC.1
MSASMPWSSMRLNSLGRKLSKLDPDWGLKDEITFRSSATEGMSGRSPRSCGHAMWCLAGSCSRGAATSQ